MIRALLDFPRGVLLGAASWAVILGATGIVLTRLDAWYYTLDFPSWKVPDWAFGPAWTTIFACAAAAGALAWTAPTATPSTHRLILIVWLINGSLNAMWSWLFFRLHRPDWSLVENIPLLMSIVGMIVSVAPHSITAVWLLVPYLSWVSFATFLNQAIVDRNGPFGA